MRSWIANIAAVVAVMVAAGLPSSGFAKEQVVLPAQGPWGLEYSEDSCTLRRVFGEGEQRTQLELRRFSPESSLQITIYTAGWPTSGRGAKVRFEPDTAWQDIQVPLYATFGGDFRGVIFPAELVPEPEDADEKDDGSIDLEMRAQVNAAYKRATGITISGAFTKDLTLRTGSLEAAHGAMQKCLSELLTHWNIDAQAHGSLTRRAVPRSHAALARAVQREYPSRMLRKGMPGLIRVRLDIDAAGKVTGCHVQLDISDPAFEQAACSQLMSAGDFLPALDRDGAPIPSYWTTAITYTTS